MSGKPIGGSRIRKDLGDPTKWGFGDLKQFGKLMLQYEADLAEIEEHRKKQREMIRDLHSSLLKCTFIFIVPVRVFFNDNRYRWYEEGGDRSIPESQDGSGICEDAKVENLGSGTYREPDQASKGHQGTLVADMLCFIESS